MSAKHPPFHHSLFFNVMGKLALWQHKCQRDSGWRERLPRKASTPTELAKEILSYFLRNPHAADSLEGVARWRLMEERVHRQLENTDQALNWLVRRGFLVKVSSEWTESVYQLNDVNRSTAERFVSESTRPTSRAAKQRRRSSSK